MQIRLFVEDKLDGVKTVQLKQEQVHYLKNVLRAEIGSEVYLFNGLDGEFLSKLSKLDKKEALLEIVKKTREQEVSRDIEICFAPVKREATELIVQKATELGATKIIPVITEFTSFTHVNIDRLKSIVLEACEQCRRIDVPELAEPISFKDFIKKQEYGTLIHLDETGNGKKIDELYSKLEKSEKISILVGPQGGFSDKEREEISKLPNTIGMDLGKRILKAETAAIASLALFTCR
ncbi:MAG: 16S rRNA (uracil(1498)-N(3))-methyltransferase [Alphaproteobacteria bacterium]|nr:16S rRNA (uracil(1498)-N(3))-methyltransferase [Alphaproteobacteria bacterium]